MYISEHKDLIPAKRQIINPQGSRGFRYHTGPGEAHQMDWGFITIYDEDGRSYRVSCFAMICHLCAECYVEFFPNVKQENLFIGMLHAFAFMGIPQYVLTDNMKSVVIRRDFEGFPVWQPDYESFMNTVGFQTKLYKPRHPFTKGKGERFIRFVLDNFLAGRTLCNFTGLNNQGLEWCEKHNNRYHREVDDIPDHLHASRCMAPQPLYWNPESYSFTSAFRGGYPSMDSSTTKVAGSESRFGMQDAMFSSVGNTRLCIYTQQISMNSL